jgi:hypothetical protein
MLFAVFHDGFGVCRTDANQLFRDRICIGTIDIDRSGKSRSGHDRG